jgi:rhodanese-related sulfurtransferase
MTEAARVGHREVQRLIEEGAQVLDALPPEDYEKQHIAGAINVPLEKFSRELIAGLDPKKQTVTYCADNQCDLSARLAARLIHEKFSQVYEYAASLADWMAYCLPIEGEDAGMVHAGDLVRREFPTCRADESVGDVAERFGKHSLCAVVDEDGVLLGRLSRADIEGNRDKTVGDVAHPGPSTFRPDVPASEMGDWFERRPKVDVFIISTPDGRPFGLLYRTDSDRQAQGTADISRA